MQGSKSGEESPSNTILRLGREIVVSDTRRDGDGLINRDGIFYVAFPKDSHCFLT